MIYDSPLSDGSGVSFIVRVENDRTGDFRVQLLVSGMSV